MKTLIEKGAIMIAADSGATIRFRAYGSGAWTYWTRGDDPELSLYDYEVARSTVGMTNEIYRCISYPKP